MLCKINESVPQQSWDVVFYSHNFYSHGLRCCPHRNSSPIAPFAYLDLGELVPNRPIRLPRPISLGLWGYYRSSLPFAYLVESGLQHFRSKVAEHL